MELRVNEIAIPEPITFNYEELKQELTEKVSVYETMVYTDENIKEAKADRANLNKLKKALNDERIRREKEYMQPFNEFKAQINEIIGIIDKPCAVIDKQVKEYEEQQKQNKAAQIDDFMKEIEKELPDDMHIPMNEKWLNASVSMKSIQEEIKAQAEQIKTDLATIENLPEFSFEAAEVYKSTLDLGKAVNEAHRLSEIAKRKAEADRLIEFVKRISDDELNSILRIVAESLGINSTHVFMAPTATVKMEPVDNAEIVRLKTQLELYKELYNDLLDSVVIRK